MVPILLLAFILVPIVEIMVFIEIGGWIGLWPTIAIVILTAVAGTALLRQQGLAVLVRFREATARGELPVMEIFTGLCLLVAGALLLTPGFVTDILGFSLFVPLFRNLVAQAVWELMNRKGVLSMHVPNNDQGGTIIDGEFEKMDDNHPRGAGRPGER